jgi:hypothetical protein
MIFLVPVTACSGAGGCWGGYLWGAAGVVAFFGLLWLATKIPKKK